MKEHMHINSQNLKLDMKSIIRFEDRLSDSWVFEIKVPTHKKTTADVKPVIHSKPKKKGNKNTQTLF